MVDKLLGGSWMDEFERIAVEKGWTLNKEARFQGALAKSLQELINSVSDELKPIGLGAGRIKVDADFGSLSEAALGKLQKAVMSDEFVRLYGDQAEKYSDIRSKLHSPTPQLWADALTNLKGLFAEVGSPSDVYIKRYKETMKGVKDPGPPKAWVDMVNKQKQQNQPKTPAAKPEPKGISPHWTSGVTDHIPNIPGITDRKSDDGAVTASQKVSIAEEVDYVFPADRVRKSNQLYKGVDNAEMKKTFRSWLNNTSEGKAQRENWRKNLQALRESGVSDSEAKSAIQNAMKGFYNKWIQNPVVVDPKEYKVPKARRQAKRSPAVRSLQRTMMQLGIKLPGKKPDDGIWGPNTAAGWNQLMKMTKDPKWSKMGVDPSGKTPPTADTLAYVAKYLAPKMLKSKTPAKPAPKTPAQQGKAAPGSPLPTTPGPSKVPTGPAVKDPGPPKEWVERVRRQRVQNDLQNDPFFKGRLADDEEFPKEANEMSKTNWQPELPAWLQDGKQDMTFSWGAVVNTLVSLANDLDDMGAKDAAMAVDRQLSKYKEAAEKLYDVTGEKGEDLINAAHPGGGPTIAPSQEEGGKVETILEEHKKLVDKVNKKPTGKYADVIQKLVAKANALEDAGQVEAAKLVDQTIHELLEGSPPFADRSSALEAAGSEDNAASEFTKKAEDDLKKKVLGIAKGIAYQIIKTRHYIDSFGSAAGKMRQLYKEVLRDLGKAMRSRGKNNSYEFASQVQAAAEKILNTDINIKDAFGSSDQSDFWQAERYIRRAVEKLKVQTSSGKTFIQAKELKNYQSTLGKIIKALKKSGRTGYKAFGGPDRVQKFIDLLQRESRRAVKYDAKTLLGRNDAIHARLFPYMKSKGISISASNHQPSGNLVVHADEFTDFLKSLPVGKKAPTKKKRAPRGKGRGRNINPQVKALQLAMVNAGIEIRGKNPVDGIWGKNTAAAYDELMTKAQGVWSNLKAPRVSPAFPGDKVVLFGLRVAKALGSTTVPLGDVEITSTITVPGTALASGKAYLNALSMGGHLKAVPKGGEVGFALKTIAQLAQKLRDDQVYAQGLDLSKGAGYTKKLIASLGRVYAQLRGYELKKKKQPNKKPGEDWKIKDELKDPWAKKPSSKPSSGPNFSNQELNINYNNPGAVASAINSLYNQRGFFEAAENFKMWTKAATIGQGYQNLQSAFRKLTQAWRQHQNRFTDPQDLGLKLRAVRDSLNMLKDSMRYV